LKKGVHHSLTNTPYTNDSYTDFFCYKILHFLKTPFFYW
jgi:hypothetical protein